MLSLNQQSTEIDPKDVARLSPVLWRHMNFPGQYEIVLPQVVALGRLRPLRNPTFEWVS